ncbi:hypothetical protein NHX12_026794 [Muraenolepis orangiensis]|uniref:XK-related protein n=1 Tax=Muraenolepis orangiensis TaxID=630683 RepID=A0A9Q0EJ87_9TELE|nr:hypothetical protein NHX12_026794 [Muraenolepis orangiensis]
MPTAAPRSACWVAWCQAMLFCASALVIVAERTALFYCVGFYLWNEETQWAGLTLGLFLPGVAVQVLSMKWYHDDGDDRRCYLCVIHLLHLGIFKRLWDCMRTVLYMRGSVGQLGAAVMQQADTAALWLLEALVLTLPQCLLQAYVVVSTDVGIMSPGHLAMPPAALLCQLVWRAGMLAARVTSLMVFARVFSWWVCGVAGFHWLTASFWLVSQQPDICTGPWCWRAFNATVGLVHIFLFLNVKDGPSRYRNAMLLLAASDFLSEATWDSMTLPFTVLCSFLLGAASMVLYYRLLHPKSTEISQGHLHHDGNRGSTCLETGESFSLGDKALSVPDHGGFTLPRAAGSLAEHPGPCGARPHSACPCYHHHWLLIRLALKTGDPGKINRAYGAGGAAAVPDMEEYNRGFKSDEATVTAGVGSCDLVSASDSLGKGLAPLSDCKEEFQSASEATSASSEEEEEEDEEEEEEDDEVEDEEEDDEEEEEETEDSMKTESRLESALSGVKRSSPEGKSVFGDSPEHYYCPTESSSTLYYSADPQSPSSINRLDGGGGPQQGSPRLASIPSDPALDRAAGRVGPCYTSTPKLDSGSQRGSAAVPHLTGPRRQLIMSRRDEEDHF